MVPTDSLVDSSQSNFLHLCRASRLTEHFCQHWILSDSADFGQSLAFGSLELSLSEPIALMGTGEGVVGKLTEKVGSVRVCPDDSPCFCRWEATPWTACSSSCGGGIQSRAVSCVEEDIQGHVSSAEEWKCMYTPKMPTVQPCNIFDCPKWLAQEWSPVTVTSFFVH